MDKFSIEEMYLMCMYDTSSKQSLLADLRLVKPFIDNPEMHRLVNTVIEKLDGMSNDEFAIIVFSADYTNYNDETEDMQ